MCEGGAKKRRLRRRRRRRQACCARAVDSLLPLAEAALAAEERRLPDERRLGERAPRADVEHAAGLAGVDRRRVGARVADVERAAAR